MREMHEATVKDQVVTITWNRREKTVTITGLYGTRVVRENNPVEIGMVVLELMTGEFIGPPEAYRTCEEEGEK